MEVKSWYFYRSEHFFSVKDHYKEWSGNEVACSPMILLFLMHSYSVFIFCSDHNILKKFFLKHNLSDFLIFPFFAWSTLVKTGFNLGKSSSCRCHFCNIVVGSQCKPCGTHRFFVGAWRGRTAESECVGSQY